MAVPQVTPELRNTAAYPEILAYFTSYPPRSVMSDHSRATLFTLIRMLRPKVVAEVGTMYAGTTEVMARALWENGEGVVYTTDPLGGDRCPAIIARWPQELRDKTHFRPLNSMDFFHELDRKHVTLDLVLVDGNHDFEYALFDLQMAARLLRPGGIVVMDNAEQSGPFKAARTFVERNPAWREVGDALASSDPAKPFDAARASVPDTSFIVLQAPDYLPIDAGPHSWGQISTRASTLEGISIELPPQTTAGTLHYQMILRAFRGNGDIPETRAIGSPRLDLAGSAATMVHRFPAPLRLDYADAQFTFEIDLSWEADPGRPVLALARMPAPYFVQSAGVS
jgi:predicted O-methyltransferase YrrM